MSDLPADRSKSLPVSGRAFALWGIITVVMTEGALFAYLLFTYFYFAAQYGHSWILEQPKFDYSGPNTVIVLIGVVCVWWAEQGAKSGSPSRCALGLAFALLLGVLFVVVQLFEWRSKPFGLSSTSYGSSYFVTTGFHLAHVVVGDLMLAATLLWALLGYFDRHRHAAVSVTAIYWYFVGLVWLAVFLTLYVTPHLRVG